VRAGQWERPRMSEHERELVEFQREHWQRTYGEHPGMYGEKPSEPAVHPAGVFRATGAREVLEPGAGQDRDALELRPFEEGGLPRRLWRVTQTVPR
jgi:hypothetical protein